METDAKTYTIRDLVRAIEAERKSCNKQFRRSDPYGNGLKRGLEIAAAMARQLDAGREPRSDG